MMKTVKQADIDPAQEAELRQAFELFDKDDSGFIDREELGMALKSLGIALDEQEFELIYSEMDYTEDGKIDLAEFCSVMGRDPAEKQTAEEIALSIFTLLDHDKSGTISTSELKETLEKVDPTLSPDDVTAAMHMFDANGGGDINKHEFIQAIETMKTFE